MESNITPNPQYTQVTVDVPEDRVAEFHAFFARFLAGPGGRRRADATAVTVTVTVTASRSRLRRPRAESAEQREPSTESD